LNKIKVKKTISNLNNAERQYAITLLNDKSYIPTDFSVIDDVEYISGKYVKAVYGFSDWKELETEKKKLISKGFNVEIVEIRTNFNKKSQFTNNIPTGEYDMKTVKTDIKNGYRLFNYEIELDIIKKSIKDDFEKKEYARAAASLQLFADAYEEYLELKENQILICNSKLFELETLPIKSMYYEDNMSLDRFVIGLKVIGEK